MSSFIARCVPVAALCLGCSSAGPAGEATAERADAIEAGYAGDDAAVVGLYVTDAEGAPVSTCSGTLIAPNVVLTAQHCVSADISFASCASSAFGAVVPPGRVRVTTHGALWEDAAVYRSALHVAVPPGGAAVCGRDIALIVLADAVTAEEALPLAPRLDEPPLPAEPYSAVGFGATSPGGTDGGQRRRRDGLLVACVGPACGAPERVDAREWRGDRGPCDGDSGGPALDADGRVIGVTSRGPEGGEAPIYGGLGGWGDWMAALVLEASELGGVDAPDWAATRDVGPTGSIEQALKGGPGSEAGQPGSCAIGAARADGSTAWLAALALLGGAASARRAARGSRKRQDGDLPDLAFLSPPRRR